MKRTLLLTVLLFILQKGLFSQVADQWTPLDDLKDFITFIIDPVDTNKIYATHSYGICKSLDGGESWTNIDLFVSDHAGAIVLNPINRDTLYLGVEAIGTGGVGIYRSANRGNTWTHVYSQESVSCLAIDPQHPHIIYAGTDYNDYTGDAIGMLKSTDAGENWVQKNSGLGNLEIQDIQINPQNPNVLYAGTNSGIFKSTDGGDSWQAANTGLPGGAVIRCIAINPVGTNIVFAGTYGDGLYRSADGGANWSASGTGISNSIIKSIAINADLPDVIYVGVGNGDVYRSQNSGASWTAMDHNGVSFIYEVGTIRLNPRKQEIIYALFGYGTSATQIYKRLENITPLGLELFATNTSSLGGTDGSIDLVVTGGQSPYTYSWSNGADTEDLTGLSARVYSVTVTDACDSTVVDSIRIYDTFVDQRDEQVYKAVTIGDQVWMAENLNATIYADGTPLVDGTTAGDLTEEYNSTKYYFYYNNDSATWSDTYGALYTWAAAMNGSASSDTNPSGVQGVCPDGWHFPSDAEWKQLEMYLGMSQEDADNQYWRGTDEGGKLKETDTIHWEYPNTGATNSSGFTALPSGYRYYSGNFDRIGTHAYFLSSTEKFDAVRYDCYRILWHPQSDIYRDYWPKNIGRAVRCIKTTTPEAVISHAGLTEENLDGAVINLALYNIYFTDASLDPQNFTLNNSPAGCAVQTVSYVSSTEATLTLAFDGTDFDSDITNFSITVSSGEITGSSDLSSNDLTIVATTEVPGQENDILTFSFPEAAGDATINDVTHHISIEVVYGTDLTGLVATFTISPGASINIGGTPQQSGVTANDFSSTVTYTVVAEDATPQDWTVAVSVVDIISVFPYYEDFEEGDGNWYADGTAISWEIGAPSGTIINSAYSGFNAWITGLGSTYNPNELSFVYSPVFDFSSLTQPAVEMKVWWVIEGTYDGACLQRSVDNGSTWVTIQKNTDYLWYNRSDLVTLYNATGCMKGWSGDGTFGQGSNGWVTAIAPLTGLSGQPHVRLRIAFASNGAIERDGFAFDDVKIYSSSTAGIVSPDESNALRIYPNPFNNKTTIEFPNPEMETYTLVITGISGKVIQVTEVTDSIIEFDREILPAGMYFVELKGSRIYRGKILIE